MQEIEKISSFEEFLTAVEQAESRVSYLGYRYVHIKNTGQDLHIDAIASRMIDLIIKNPNFSDSERNCIRQISGRIDQIYDKSDEQVARSWFFVRLFVWVRDLYNSEFPYHSFSSVRWSWRECKDWNMCGDRNVHLLYTKEEYQELVGRQPPECPTETFAGVPRWHLPGKEYFRP